MSYVFTSFCAVYKREFDIVQSHAYLPGIFAHYLKNAKNVPVVLTVHGTSLRCPEYFTRGTRARLMTGLEELILLWLEYTHIITVGKDFLDLAKNHRNVTYIPNGVDLQEYDKTLRKTNDVLFVGRLHKQKCVDTLVHAKS